MGDRDRARDEVAQALAIDPDFLAARLLRDQLDGPAVEVAATPAALAPPPPAQPQPPTIAASTLTEFEERIRERVRQREATARAAGRRGRHGARMAAAAAFLAAMSGASVREPAVLLSRSVAMLTPLVDSAAPPALAPADDAPEPTVSEAASDDAVVLPSPTVARSAPVVLSSSSVVAPVAVVPPQPQPPVEVAAVTASQKPAAAVTPGVDDRALVAQTLAHYRRAYNRLDARAAQAVYPAVNQPALARAFDGLQSQSLVFDACDVDVRGGSATVTCHGSSSYVPKVGSREPRVEPRIWNFTLRKDAGDWKIENARAALTDRVRTPAR